MIKATTEDEDEEEEGCLTADNGLSPSTLELLLQFQYASFFEEEDVIPKTAVCATYTVNDSKVIAETLKRLQKKDVEVFLTASMVLRDLLEPAETSVESLARTLREEGVVRINRVLPDELCDECLHAANAALFRSSSSDHDSSGGGFGNVYSRNCRYDMYIRSNGTCYGKALAYMLGTCNNNNNNSASTCRQGIVGELFHQLLNKEAGIFHELSVLISDSGSASQPIHPDSPYSEHAPLYTVFIALQDIDQDMGPTVFLPGTHTPQCHYDLKHDGNELLTKCRFQRALLKKGDVTVMDSRCFHFGDANITEGAVAKRRALLYFTIRNPIHSNVEEGYPSCGSKWADLHLTTHDF